MRAVTWIAAGIVAIGLITTTVGYLALPLSFVPIGAVSVALIVAIGLVVERRPA